MVKTDNRCETIISPAPTETSFPYADGITIMFIPSGIAKTQVAQMVAVCEKFIIGNNATIPKNKSGKNSSFIAVTT